MPRWEKEFGKWASCKLPEPVDSVKALIYRVFGDRVSKIAGGSHQYIIDVPELVDLADYQFGTISIPIKGGQSVKAFYLRKIHTAASILIERGCLGGDEENEDSSDDE